MDVGVAVGVPVGVEVGVAVGVAVGGTHVTELREVPVHVRPVLGDRVHPLGHAGLQLAPHANVEGQFPAPVPCAALPLALLQE